MKECNETERQHIIRLFTRLDVENLQSPSVFCDGILDIFPGVLSNEESSEIVFLDLYKTHEKKFISFFSHIFLRNNKVIHIRPYSVINSSEKYMKKRGLNQKEQNIIKKLCVNQNKLYRIEDIEELIIIVKATIREAVLSIFYLENTVFIGNFDLSIPVFARSKDEMISIRDYAKRNELFLRV